MACAKLFAPPTGVKVYPFRHWMTRVVPAADHNGRFLDACRLHRVQDKVEHGFEEDLVRTLAMEDFIRVPLPAVTAFIVFISQSVRVASSLTKISNPAFQPMIYQHFPVKSSVSDKILHFSFPFR